MDRSSFPFWATNGLGQVHESRVDLSERYDDYSSFGGAAKPKISIRYKPFDELTFRFSYSESFRAPSVEELFTGP